MDPPAPQEATLDQLVELIRARRSEEGPAPCALLAGAGCSATGGVPLADDLVRIMRSEYPFHYERISSSLSYQECMARLPDAYRRDLIREYCERATINHAHLGIAQLVKAGYVGRILTTNFDPLIVRACALVGEFPAVYDCAVSPRLEGVFFHPKSVFYLHGQWSGLKLHNVEEDLRRQAELVRPVIVDVQKDRLWMIVGYSGRSDPLIDVMAEAGEYPCGLFWVAHQDKPPDPGVRTKLLAKPNMRLINGLDADSFFRELARSLGCYPPEFVTSREVWAEKTLYVCRAGPYGMDENLREPLEFPHPPAPTFPQPIPQWSP
jgi:hypothetical protein